jgi:hypothetical protein
MRLRLCNNDISYDEFKSFECKPNGSESEYLWAWYRIVSPRLKYMTNGGMIELHILTETF